jgi:hypothetical protein
MKDVYQGNDVRRSTQPAAKGTGDYSVADGFASRGGSNDRGSKEPITPAEKKAPTKEASGRDFSGRGSKFSDPLYGQNQSKAPSSIGPGERMEAAPELGAPAPDLNAARRDNMQTRDVGQRTVADHPHMGRGKSGGSPGDSPTGGLKIGKLPTKTGQREVPIERRNTYGKV